MTENSSEVVSLKSLEEPMAMGDVFAQSGMFPDIKSKAQAAVKILAGKELGLSPFESMIGIYLVSGRLALTANTMASLIKRGNKYDYAVEEHTEETCKIMFYKHASDGSDDPLGESIFTIKDAARAGIANKDNWKNYPRNMLFARALANGCRWYCPDAVRGYYTLEEMQDVQTGPVSAIVELTKEGEVTDGTKTETNV